MILSAVIIQLIIGLTNAENRSKCLLQEQEEGKLLLPGSHPKTALASFQGSGNTWMRQLIASATGYKTGDVYKEEFLNEPSFAILTDDTVLAIKTHTFGSSNEKLKFQRAVLIARHPQEALFAEFNRVYGSKTGYPEASRYVHEDGSTTWEWDVWTTYMRVWVNFYSYWIQDFKGDIHIVYYNNLKKDLDRELQSMVRFLLGSYDAERINCTVSNNNYNNQFKRKSSKAPVDKEKLFKMSAYKAKQAVDTFKTLVKKRFGENSREYLELDMDHSR